MQSCLSFPCQHRHGLGYRLIAHHYELLEQLAKAPVSAAAASARDPRTPRRPDSAHPAALAPAARPLADRLVPRRLLSRLIRANGRQHSAWLAQQ
ncbi:MAG: hypothetical protein ACK56I_06695, partial [bacterium]